MASLPDPNGLGYRAGYCHEPSTRLLTADLRWRAAGDVVVGDELWALEDEQPKGRRGRAFRRAVVLASFLSKKDCVRVCLDNGESFVCSADHPWLATPPLAGRGEWRRADRLIYRGRGAKLVRTFLPWTEERSYEAGWLAGILDGEGSVSRGHRASFHPANGVSITQVLGATADRIALKMGSRVSTNVRTIERPGVRPRIEIETNGGGMAAAAAFLGTVRAERLIAGFDIEGGHVLNRFPVHVAAIERVGIREVQSIQTSTGTYIAEGFAVHNTGTLCQHGHAVASPQPGDLVFYGSGAPWHHVAVYVGGGRVVSHGSEGGPFLEAMDYRGDRGQIRRYV
jgi:hypothetical protein